MKVAMMFPGFGSQYVGMAKALYDEHRIVQEYFEEASNCLDINFVKLCFASSESELSNMRNAYTSIFLVSSSIIGLLAAKGIHPEVVAGFNQGEYAALFAAGGWTLPDGLYLLNKFAAFYQEVLDEIDVAAIHISGITAFDLEALCFQVNSYSEDQVIIAIYETENEHIITGGFHAIERMRDLIVQKNDNAQIEAVDLAIGLHSSLMNPVIERYRMYLEKVDFNDLKVCMLESLNGECIEKGIRTKERVIQRINSPIFWTKVIEGLAPYDILIQVGPGNQLAHWAAQVYPNKHVMAINTTADIEKLERIIEKNNDDYRN